jgi:catechol 2,3-dioxygenase
VELYFDKPRELWPRTPDGKLAMFSRPLDLRALLKEAAPDVPLSPGPQDL